LQGKVVQAINGVEEIKTLSLEDDKSKELSEFVTGLKTCQIKQANVFSISSVFSTGLNNIVSILILLVCGYFVVFHHLSLGTYMMFSMYIPMLCGNIQSITTVFVHLKPTMISFKRIETFFYEVEEEDMNCTYPIDEIRTITIENLKFKYANNPNPIINDLNLSIEENDKILVTGKNGSGKTTLLRLLLGLYRVDDGKILVNGVHINDIKRDSLRNRISTVSQKIHLFNDSIKNNIVCHYDIDTKQYLKILDVVNLADFIQTLELKDDTLVGENGINLSGGQIQKIAIARALIRNTNVFLFDEFLSNVDEESRSIIEALLQDMLKDKICIFIEHQPLFGDICNKSINMEKANYYIYN
jgi:ABC-type bacteriocin/lantibiotic exporter with double-glycine peptidase domain